MGLRLINAAFKCVCEEEDQEEKTEQQKSISELPFELVFEILTRLPLDALRRQCRLVCKDWRNFSFDSNFRNLHSQKTRTISGHFIQRNDFFSYHTTFVSNIVHSPPIPSPTLDFLPCQQLKVLASAEFGLLFCVSKVWPFKHYYYYVCKPTTRQWMQIPSPNTKFWIENFAMVVKKSDPLHYKILRFSQPVMDNTYNIEIFDSNYGEWKVLKGVDIPNGVVLGPGQALLIQGTLHWLFWFCDSILGFDVDQECWMLVELPPEIAMREGRRRLVEYNGKLGLLYSDIGFMEIWVMESYVKQKWQKKYHISLDMEFMNGNFRSAVPLDLYNAEIVLMQFQDELMWFNYKSKTCTAETVTLYGATITQAYPFESDFVPLKLGQ